MSPSITTLNVYLLMKYCKTWEVLENKNNAIWYRGVKWFTRLFQNFFFIDYFLSLPILKRSQCTLRKCAFSIRMWRAPREFFKRRFCLLTARSQSDVRLETEVSQLAKQREVSSFFRWNTNGFLPAKNTCKNPNISYMRPNSNFGSLIAACWPGIYSSQTALHQHEQWTCRICRGRWDSY